MEGAELLSPCRRPSEAQVLNPEHSNLAHILELHPPALESCPLHVGISEALEIYLTQSVTQMVSDSQISHKVINLSFTFTD